MSDETVAGQLVLPVLPVLPREPAVAGWFTTDDEPALLGSRCTSCGALAFPPVRTFCRNPACAGSAFEEYRLSRTGVVWSYTDARYRPPPPYVAVTDPYEPFGIVAVELAAEAMVVLGQLSQTASVDQLEVGQPVELVVEELFRDEDGIWLIWRWRPLPADGSGDE